MGKPPSPRITREQANRLARDIREAAERRGEENFKIRCEHFLQDRVLKRLGIDFGLYEYTVARGSIDSLYGSVVIEYEAPGTLARPAGYAHAKSQAIRYITELAGDETALGRFLGVVIDGRQIGFVRFRGGQWKDSEGLEVNESSVLRLLEAIRGLQRKPLRADLLASSLGPGSEAAKAMVGKLYNLVVSSREPKPAALFEDWKRVFGQICGYSPEKLKGLDKEYGLSGQRGVNLDALLFSLHTYFALVMKILASELVSLHTPSLGESFVDKIEAASAKGGDELRRELSKVENGGLFAQAGIRNFLEGDYFSWYLEVWDKSVEDAFHVFIRKLAQFEPATMVLEPEQVQDLLKDLYQYLIPKRMRHDLGEFYTPDWLAELVLREVGFFEKPSSRILDPACGTGTFLVLATKAKTEMYRSDLGATEALDRVLREVIGFDLNPLAVIASRTNYLLALGDLVAYRRGDIQIPVFLADSVFVNKRASIEGGVNYSLHTAVGEFVLPAAVVESSRFGDFLTALSQAIQEKWQPADFIARVDVLISDLRPADQDIVSELYRLFLKLDKGRKNRVWGPVIRNAFAPLFEEKFDLVVGNPPWVNWSELSDRYRTDTRKLWTDHGLIPANAALGRAERDLAMLFVTTSIRRYTKLDGRFGLLVPLTLFRSQAAAGFRKVVGSEGRIERIVDLVETRPFEGAINRTALLIGGHGDTSWPVRYDIWKSKSAVDTSSSLKEVEDTRARHVLVCEPVTEGRVETPWLVGSPGTLSATRRLIGPASYEGRLGLHTGGLNGVFWVETVSTDGANARLKNQGAIGKNKVRTVEAVVETEYLFPLARGRDAHRWIGKPSTQILLPHDGRGRPIPIHTLRVEFPKTYAFFHEFFKELASRKSVPYSQQLVPWLKTNAASASRSAPPFYYIFNAAGSMAPYKVAWKYISGKVSGKGDLSACIFGPSNSPLTSGKPVIPDVKLGYVGLESADEAHFVCAVLNSTPARLVVAGYAVETAISTHILSFIKCPKYDRKDPLHKRIVETAYLTVKAKEEGEDSRALERRVSVLVGKLEGIDENELGLMETALETLLGTESDLAEASDEEDVSVEVDASR